MTNNSDLHTTAVLLIAHGSRNTAANDDLFHLAHQIRADSDYHIVEASFLELADPTIEVAAARCVDQGATTVIMMPYFLSAGIHVRRDLTELCRQLSEGHASVNFRLAAPLGRHPLLTEIVLQRMQECALSDVL